MQPERLSMKRNPLQPTDHFVSARLCLFKLVAGRTLAQGQSSTALPGRCSGWLQGAALRARTGEPVAGSQAGGWGRRGGVEDPSQVCLGSRGIWGKNNSPQYLCNEALQAPIHMQDH